MPKAGTDTLNVLIMNIVLFNVINCTQSTDITLLYGYNK